MSTHRPYRCLAYLIMVIFVAACQSVSMGATLPKPAATRIPAPPARPDPRMAPPSKTVREGFLVSRVPGIPNVQIVDEDQPKLEFASSLAIMQIDSLPIINLESKQQAKLILLNLINPGLSEIIKSGTLVIIPPLDVRLSSEATKLASSAEPLLLIAPIPLSLDKVTQKFHVTMEQLIAANPALGNLSKVPANTVLIIPLP